jgi:hypothetical protein
MFKIQNVSILSLNWIWIRSQMSIRNHEYNTVQSSKREDNCLITYLFVYLLIRLALEEGDVSVFLESDEEEPRLTSSLLTIPTYIKVGLTSSLLTIPTYVYQGRTNI